MDFARAGYLARVRLVSHDALASPRAGRLRAARGRNGAGFSAASAHAGTGAETKRAAPDRGGARRSARRAARRSCRPHHSGECRLASHCGALRNAQFGVVIFSAGELDALALEMLAGMIEDLNAKTRFFALPIPAPGNAVGVVHALAAQSGYPVRIGFARGEAEHDPWRFDAARMAASGETDLVLWIGERLPEWAEKVRLMALVPEGAALAPMPEVVLFAGKPGSDHDAVLYDPELGTLAFRRGAGRYPSAAEILQSITKAVQAW